MKITEINNYSDFLALEDRWNDILQRCDHNIFSTWEWLSIWWKHNGKDKRLLVLLAEENDRILGIAPLMFSVHTMFGLRMRKIEFIGAGESDYNTFILAEKGTECMKLFIEYLRSLPITWDYIDLLDIPENSNCLSFLQKNAKELKPVHWCPYLPLPSSYEEFLDGMSSNYRRYLKKGTKRLEEAFDVKCVDCSDINSYADGMHWLFELHQMRWTLRGLPGAFSEKRFRDFHLDVAKTFSQKNWLNLYLLNLSGKTVAASYGFIYQDKYYSYLSGFDPRYYKHSVGNLLRAYLIRDFIKNGLVEFDFMRGAEQYKHRWNAKDRVTRQAIFTRTGFLSNVRDWLYKEYWLQGSRLKYIMKLT